MFGESAISRVIWEPFKNESGGVIPAFAVMHHNGYEERGGNFVMKMEQPSSTFRRQFYINGPHDVPYPGTGSCTRYSAYALCDSGNTPAQDEEWGPKPSSWKLWRGYPGATILGAPTGTGEDQRSKVVVEPINMLLAKNGITPIDARSGTTVSSESVEVYCCVGTTLTDTTWNVDAYNEAATAVAASAYLQIHYLCGKWFVNWEECP